MFSPEKANDVEFKTLEDDPAQNHDDLTFHSRNSHIENVPLTEFTRWKEGLINKAIVLRQKIISLVIFLFFCGMKLRSNFLA